jgi:hypothetical protein
MSPAGSMHQRRLGSHLPITSVVRSTNDLGTDLARLQDHLEAVLIRTVSRPDTVLGSYQALDNVS